MREKEISCWYKILKNSNLKIMSERKKICKTEENGRNFASKSNKMSVMKLVNFLSILLLSANVAVASCSSSKTEASARMERTIRIPNSYKSVKTSNGLIVNYTASASNGETVCTVAGPAEVVERIEAVVKDNRLHIKTKDGRGLNLKSDASVIVSVSGLAVSSFAAGSGSIFNVNSSLNASADFSVDASSGAVINFNGQIRCKDCSIDISSGAALNLPKLQASGVLEVDASSGAVFTGEIDVRDVELDLSSGAVLNLKGKAKACEIDASSGSVLNLSGLEVSGRADVDASSGAIVNLGKKAKVRKSSGAIVQ